MTATRSHDAPTTDGAPAEGAPRSSWPVVGQVVQGLGGAASPWWGSP